ncbi:DUF6480 family protein [Streptomyces sp. NPDC004284]|uniref:DUF6480 family protein n=1 Tax=Streptomyces sp. NPDC004284 TaxID=3364695 RepID=UPI003684ADC7
MQCVPFRIYGLNLFDVVRLDEDDMLVEVVEKGGHRTLRALLRAGLEPRVFQEVAGGIASRARAGASPSSGAASATWRSTCPPTGTRLLRWRSWTRTRRPGRCSGSGATPSRSTAPGDAPRSGRIAGACRGQVARPTASSRDMTLQGLLARPAPVARHDGAGSGEQQSMATNDPDPDPRRTTGLTSGGAVPPGETPPAESGTGTGTGPHRSPKRGWAGVPLALIIGLAVLVALFFLAYGIVVAL